MIYQWLTSGIPDATHGTGRLGDIPRARTSSDSTRADTLRDFTQTGVVFKTATDGARVSLGVGVGLGFGGEGVGLRHCNRRHVASELVKTPGSPTVHGPLVVRAEVTSARRALPRAGPHARQRAAILGVANNNALTES